MGSFELEIKQEFLVEALMNVEEVQALFAKHESTGNSSAILEKMFFVAHNLKGGSLSVGFNEIAELTNNLETLILKVKNDEIKLSPKIISTVLRSNLRLVEMLQTLQANFSASFDNKDFMSDIQSCYVNDSEIAN